MARKGIFGVSLYRKRMVKFSSMNKSKKRSWKAYRGQG